MASAAATTFSGDHCIHGFTKLPFPPACFRSISAPINSLGSKNLFDESQAQNSVVNHHPAAATGTGMKSHERLKIMKDRMREMSQWWNEVIKESEEDIGSEDNDNLSKL
ncbi:hypothetical protein ACH5RR_018288 [Cinchona calisaya]|uniref:Uncharacterized protein n=1 Tax=Cinchona calisaya TaxID=153742 RepID=A0ABD2ZKZ8_9GENT